MTTEREQTRRTRTASEERTAIFWTIVIYGTLHAIGLAIIIFLLAGLV